MSKVPWAPHTVKYTIVYQASHLTAEAEFLHPRPYSTPDSVSNKFSPYGRLLLTMSSAALENTSAASDLAVRALPRLTPRKRKTSRPNPHPAPNAPPLPTPQHPNTIGFAKPTRRVLTSQDLELFQRSPSRRPHSIVRLLACGRRRRQDHILDFLYRPFTYNSVNPLHPLRD